ncbi:MAG: hypothetical protein ACU0CB_14380 [Roseovarius sp.]
MLGVGMHPFAAYRSRVPIAFPAGFSWDRVRFDTGIEQIGGDYRAAVEPRDLVDPAIWSGAAIHVDGVAGDDGNSGLGADGDFTNAKRTIHAAFTAGNATGVAYRVLVKPGDYAETAFTRNGNDEPSQPVAVIGWGGPLRYRTGPFDVTWSDSAGTFTANESSVRRVFRSDLLTPEGLYTELREAADVASCAATVNTWVHDGALLHVNIGSAPGARDIAVVRSFHGARFLTHDKDFYLENVHCEGGITGALHFDAVATRNIVGVNCTFRYSAPSTPTALQDAARVRRTNGLVAFFDCDASGGAKDGWSFHEDGTPGMHVLLLGCSGWRNGLSTATSCNGFTTHDGVRAILLSGDFGLSRNGTEVHVIQSTETWAAGCHAVARDVDGSSVAFKCSNDALMWLQDCSGDAAGQAENYALQANAGTVFTRGFLALAGGVEVTSGGSVSPF